MSRLRALSPGLLCACLSLSLSCQDTSQEPAAAAPPPAQALAPTASAPAKAASADTLVLPRRAPEEPGVALQMVFANPAAYLVALGGIEAFAPYRQYFDPKGLQALMAMGAGEAGDAVRGILLDRPSGCAMLNRDPLDEAFACAFFFEGGPQNFVQKLGPSVSADPKGHLASIDLGQKSLYIDALGDAVAVSSGPSTFAALRGQLEKGVLARGATMSPQLEFVMFGTGGADLLAAVEKLAPPPALSEPIATGDPALDQLARIGYRVQVWQRENAAASWKGIQQYFGSTSVANGVPVLDFAMYVDPASPLGEAYKKASYTSLPEDALGILPPGAMAFLFAGLDTSKWGELGLSTEQGEAFARIWAEETGVDLADLRGRATGFFASWAKLYTEMTALVLDKRDDGRVGVAFVRRLRPGQGEASTADWRAFARDFNAERILGKVVAAAFRFEFVEKAREVDGVVVDRLTVHFGAELTKKLQDESDPLAHSFADGLVIERLTVGDYVLVCFDLDPRASSLKSWIDTLRAPSLAARVDSLGQLPAQARGATVVMGVDLGALLVLFDAPQTFAASGLDDLSLVGTSVQPANFVMRMAPSTRLLGEVARLTQAAAAEPLAGPPAEMAPQAPDSAQNGDAQVGG